MGWGENDRGVSFTFGAEVVAKFLHKHDFDLICRAHQVRHYLYWAVELLTCHPCCPPGGQHCLRWFGEELFSHILFSWFSDSLIIYLKCLKLPCHVCVYARWWRMGTSSLPSVSWSRCSPLPTTAASSTTPVRWCPWTRHSCAPSRFWRWALHSAFRLWSL